MELTQEVRREIDDMEYIDMLRKWRFTPPGEPMFQGASGNYFSLVMQEKRDENPGRAVSASKAIGRYGS